MERSTQAVGAVQIGRSTIDLMDMNKHAGDDEDEQQAMSEDVFVDVDKHGKFLQGILSIVTSSFGLAIDFYDINVIACVKDLMAETHGNMSAVQNSTLSASALIGAVAGQLIIGSLGDHLGRRMMFISCALLTTVGAGLSALVSAEGSHIYWLLAMFRFIMGLGIGGEYPISASHTAENSDVQNSARNLAVVCAAIPFGAILAPSVVWLCLRCGLSSETTWRAAFSIGAIISAASLILRVAKVENSDSFKQEQDQQGFRRSLHLLKRYRMPLIAAACSWFMYDIIYYGLSMFSAEIIAGASHTSPREAVFQVLLISLMAMPGALLGIVLIPKLGRKPTFILSLTIMCGIFLLLAFIIGSLSAWLFTFLFGLQLTFDRVGPCPLSYMIPAEIFPTAVRATGHGICAAFGKCGAIVGVYIVGLLKAIMGVKGVFAVIGAITAVEILWVVVAIPSYNERTLQYYEDVDRHATDKGLLAWLYGGGFSGRPLPAEVVSAKD